MDTSTHSTLSWPSSSETSSTQVEVSQQVQMTFDPPTPAVSTAGTLPTTTTVTQQAGQYMDTNMYTYSGHQQQYQPAPAVVQSQHGGATVTAALPAHAMASAQEVPTTANPAHFNPAQYYPPVHGNPSNYYQPMQYQQDSSNQQAYQQQSAEPPAPTQTHAEADLTTTTNHQTTAAPIVSVTHNAIWQRTSTPVVSTSTSTATTVTPVTYFPPTRSEPLTADARHWPPLPDNQALRQDRLFCHLRVCGITQTLAAEGVRHILESSTRPIFNEQTRASLQAMYTKYREAAHQYFSLSHQFAQLRTDQAAPYDLQNLARKMFYSTSCLDSDVPTHYDILTHYNWLYPLAPAPRMSVFATLANSDRYSPVPQHAHAPFTHPPPW